VARHRRHRRRARPARQPGRCLLRGKHKPTFAPHVDTGDFVIIINADKVALTGAKLQQKRAYRHSGYPGGLSETLRRAAREATRAKAVEKAIRGMLPKNSLGRQQLSKLKVYAGAEHPHAAQKPSPTRSPRSRSNGADRQTPRRRTQRRD
jgi:large subunit ribosomal protein L13